MGIGVAVPLRDIETVSNHLCYKQLRCPNLWPRLSLVIAQGELFDVVRNPAIMNHAASQVKLIDGSGHMMWPAFLNVQPAEPLPWVLPDGFSVLFYFQIQDDLFAICPQTAEKVETARFAFSNGTVINVPVRKDGCTGRTDDCVWACADDPALPKVDMTMRLVQ
ncbi:hypothetical protein SAMN05421878_11446 [Actinobaculum suis]|uniref:Uncharacterized protein n=1 Tax=Actinobaculum suis TaxID=1657 RepID=A0A1G7E2N6_9ACTO|nr:hypothetical protein SAMN05421878_11446 [Actinobaculum suis]